MQMNLTSLKQIWINPNSQYCRKPKFTIHRTGSTTLEDYYNRNSSLPSPKGMHFSEIEADSSKTDITPTMMTGSTTLEEEMANMKAILENLTRESAEKEACIKFQEEKIARLTKKLEKQSTQSLAKDSKSEDSEKVSVHTEVSENEKKIKKGSTPKHVRSSGLMTIEQIQYLIANAVKAQLGEGSHRTHLYTKPYTKRVDALRMPPGYQPPKFQ